MIDDRTPLRSLPKARRRRVGLGVAALAALATAPAFAYAPLEIGGMRVFWGSTQVSYGLGWAVNDEWDAAVRSAFGSWNAATGAAFRVVEDPGLRGQTDTSGPTHLVVHDESNQSGWFTDASFVAVTPIWTDASGRITDADIILNGRDYAFTTEPSSGAYDVQAIVAHEAAHFIGFDHSAISNATVYPYVAPNDHAPRSLSPDELCAARSLAPGGWAELSGRVVRAASGAGVQGAHVVALDPAGHALASVLTRADGSFVLGGLDPGTVRVFVEPLDGPVTDANLFSRAQSDFQTVEAPGSPLTLGQSQGISFGTIGVGPKQLTVSALFAPELEAGGAATITVSGSGFQAGATEFSLLGAPGVRITGANGGAATWQLSVEADPGAEPGLRTLLVTVGGRVALVPGAVEVVGLRPTVSEVSPAAGAEGTPITIEGTGFRPGALVSVGAALARNVVVLDGGRIQATVPAGPVGTATVRVQNADGRSVNLPAGFQYDVASADTSQTTSPLTDGPDQASGGNTGGTGDAPPPPPPPGGGGGSSGCALTPASAASGSWPADLLACLALAALLLRARRAASARRPVPHDVALANAP